MAAILRAKSKPPVAEYDRSLVWSALLLAALGLVMVYRNNFV